MRRLRFRIPAPGLPERLRGFRFTQVSDLHLAMVHGGVDRLADTVLVEEPEAIFLTGDFINRSHRIEPALHFVSRLRARCGVWAVMGNWERNWRIDEELLRRELASRGATLLNNEAQPVMENDPSALITSDGSHFTEEGYKLLDKTIAYYLRGWPMS